MKRIYFDIETGGRADAFNYITKVEAPANYKDPEKIKQYIAEKTADVLNQTALDAITGEILAIGATYDGSNVITLTGEEGRIIRDIYDLILDADSVVGFNIFNFDLPYIVRRGWVHNIPLPYGWRNGKYWTNKFIDLRDIWGAGQYSPSGSLDSIGKVLGLGGKSDTEIGKHFADVFKSNPEQALNYLRRDVILTYNIAKRIM